MYVLVNKTDKAIVYRCEKLETLRALANIELSWAKVSILEETSISAWNCFETHNLQELFKSLTGGTDPHSHNAPYLIGQIIRLCQTAPVANVDGFEVTVQSLQLKAHDKDFYRYRKGKSCAEHLEDPYRPPALLGDWKAAQNLPVPSAATAQQAPATAPQQAKSWELAPSTTPPKYAPPWL
jgi:hypothetical protein